MSKVSTTNDLPDICTYLEGDEEIFHVGTFEEAKLYILKEIETYIKRLETITYKEWKKDGTLFPNPRA